MNALFASNPYPEKVSASATTPCSSADSVRDALAQYHENGFHIQPGVFDLPFCDALIEEAESFPAARSGDSRTALQPHKHSEIFRRALRHPTIARVMSLILGGPISGLQTQFFYGRPGTPGFRPHQDNWFVQAPKGQFASVWVALTDVAKENGCLMIFPKTHMEPLLPIEEREVPETMLQDANALRWGCVAPDTSPPQDVVIRKGSAAFFDGHTVHASHANISSACRYALLMTYISRGAPYIPGRYAQRQEVPID